ncbi:MAG: cobamide remodeling phosphodiesterase CbiR [Caldilinea sp.]
MSVDVRTWGAPFRIGATSYIVDAGLVENARFLATHVQDVQLVLFDLPNGPSNLPDAATVDQLATLGARRDLTYTVHLIADLQSAPIADDPAFTALHPSLDAAERVIDCTRRLEPAAWVGHLQGRAMRARGFVAEELPAWWAQAAQAIEQAGAWAGGVQRLAIENLEGYPPDFVTPVVERTQAARCVDVGHLWLDGYDPIFHLRAAWRRLRVVHLHGVLDDAAQPNRDHRALTLTPEVEIDRIVHFLLRNKYCGVLTLEIFGEDDFWSSLAALHASIQRFEE